MQKRTIALAVCAAALAAAGIAAASIPDGAGNIHACAKLDTGVLRAIDVGAGDSCKASERALQWNVIPPHGLTGPQGQPGPKGPVGPKGFQGAAGANAMTLDPKTMKVSALVAAAQQVGGFFASLTCPEGTKALWGGWNFFSWTQSKPPPMAESFPISDNEWGFAVGAGNESVGSASYIYLLCAVAR